MISIMIARLLEGAPAETTAKACTDNPVLAAVVGGMNPAQAIVSGGGPLLADSSGQAWSGKYIVASGNLFADFHANATAEMQGIMQATRLYNMTDDPGVREMLRFNIARDTMHQNMWLAALEELRADGLETLPVPAQHPFDERTWITPTSSRTCPSTSSRPRDAGPPASPPTARASSAGPQRPAQHRRAGTSALRPPALRHRP
jgi:Mn-containing catalase